MASETLLRTLATPQYGQRLQRLVEVAAPAAGAEWSTVVPGGSVWRVVTLRGQLVSSAVAGNRAVRVVLDDGQQEFARIPSQNNQAASLTHVYTFTVGIGPGHEVIRADAPWSGFPDMALPAGYRIRTSTDSLDVGDQWSGIRLLVEELLTWDPAYLARVQDAFPLPQ